MTTQNTKRRGRGQLISLALVFFGPLAIAAWLYFAGGALQPQGRTNHGELLQPLVNIEGSLTASSISDLDDGRWLLVYAHDGACGDPCRYSLYTIRQSRLMLGRDMERLVRVFLHGNEPPDTAFLADEHAGLVTLRDERLSALLEKKRPVDVSPGGFFLVDPLGNLVMYFPADIDPADMVEAIEHLLKFSRIG